jgi:hypothetical protein
VPHEAHVIDTCCGDTHVLSAGEGDGDAVCVYLPGTNFTTSSSSVVLEELRLELRHVRSSEPTVGHDVVRAEAFGRTVTQRKSQHLRQAVIEAGKERATALDACTDALVDPLDEEEAHGVPLIRAYITAVEWTRFGQQTF